MIRLRLLPFLLLTVLGQLGASPPTLEQFDTLTLSFAGPPTAENAAVNPFTDTRLLVTFTHADRSYVIRGFFAADGNAAETSADSGKIWQVRFTPDRLGEWTYAATLRQGADIALSDAPTLGHSLPLASPSGHFTVTPSTATGRDFRARGRIIADRGFFRFRDTEDYFLKGGTNSPENLLAFADFDGTYRYNAEARSGEAAPQTELHAYPTHVADWRPGDPTWQDGKGKGLIGGLNYLADSGMNVAYFLTMNIGGDGKDVWPYIDHKTFDRFDCSKLDQWELVFQHMSRRGIMLHVVTQETENERMLDDGDTGRLRQLYYRELIARFGHHLALVWNLGEENGPADFSPLGQTPVQQRAMATFLKAHDPYQHPVLIHTHAWDGAKQHGLPPLFNHAPLDGLSFQVDKRQTVHAAVIDWKKQSREAGQEWLITMDEIGMWHTGAVPDSVDPSHDMLRHHVLWGSLLAGAAGVEWYFGAHHPHNDLTAEDWRTRHNLWRQTRIAIEFLSALPFAHMQPSDELTLRADDYVLAKPGQTYVIYAPHSTAPFILDFQNHLGEFEVLWLDPLNDHPLRAGSTPTVTANGPTDLGAPPIKTLHDWVLLVRRPQP